MKLVVLASLGLLLAGCSVNRNVQQGIDDYHRADYLAAGYRFEGLARYLTFRGLTEYHIGMRDAARVHLLRARDVLRVTSPEAVDVKTLREMDAALADLEGDGTPAPAPVVMAEPPPV